MTTTYWEKPSLKERILRIYIRGGLGLLLVRSLKVSLRPFKEQVAYTYFKYCSPGTFTLNGSEYRYFCHKYNATWRNERAVEIPIVWDILKKHQGKRILEVGHVLGHYFPIRHDVVDKYEVAAGVINEDAVDFRPSEKYDLIVSISTLEHVGWDDEPREPDRALAAVRNLLDNCLGPGGLMLVTLPLGWNTAMDKFLEEGGLRFDDRLCLKRAGGQKWEQASWGEAKGSPYNHQVMTANAVVIGFLKKES